MIRLIGATLAGIAIAMSASGCASPGAESSPSSEVPPVSETSPPLTAEETAIRMGECLARKGWAVETDGHSNSVRTPPEQRDQFQADVDMCADETGASEPGIPLTPEYLAVQYERTGDFRECLIEHGLQPPELPSYQAYEELILGAGQFYDVGALAGLDALDPLRKECDDPFLTWGRE